jgi:hypothetical protein
MFMEPMLRILGMGAASVSVFVWLLYIIAADFGSVDFGGLIEAARG